jgi:hypothetical protein
VIRELDFCSRIFNSCQYVIPIWNLSF